MVRGKSEAITLYEVFDADPAELRETKKMLLPLFWQAYDAFWSNELGEAQELFEQYLFSHPTDPVAKMYLERCR